jgi:hypothetical protein
MERCVQDGGCAVHPALPPPSSAYEVVVEQTTFTVWPDVPEFTVNLETLYQWGDLKRPTKKGATVGNDQP